MSSKENPIPIPIPIEEIMKECDLFWQYPVITEKTFYLQNKDDPHCLSIPWATLIDTPTNLQYLIKRINGYCNKTEDYNYYTCCQHIYYSKIIPICKFLGITKVYSPHKQKGLDVIEGVEIIACPLYAVNYEDITRNKEFKNIDFETNPRKFLYSFMGGYQSAQYISKIRLDIFKIPPRDDIFIENTGDWHFNKIVYNIKQNKKLEENKTQEHVSKTELYNIILMSSRFSLSPSGSGPNSIRFWESLAVGAIPILLSDKLELPKHPDWDKAIIILKEDQLDKLDEILSQINDTSEIAMRKKCIEIYNHFQNNYRNRNI